MGVQCRGYKIENLEIPSDKRKKKKERGNLISRGAGSISSFEKNRKASEPRA